MIVWHVIINYGNLFQTSRSSGLKINYGTDMREAVLPENGTVSRSQGLKFNNRQTLHAVSVTINWLTEINQLIIIIIIFQTLASPMD